jgi:hypothetical protein
MQFNQLFIKLIVLGLKTDLTLPKVVVSGTRYGAKCYYLNTKTDLTKYGFDGPGRSQVDDEGFRSFFLGCGVEQALTHIVTLTRNWNEKQVPEHLKTKIAAM